MKNNGLYDNGRNLFALGEIKWTPDGSKIKAILVDPTVYTPDLNKFLPINLLITLDLPAPGCPTKAILVCVP